MLISLETLRRMVIKVKTKQTLFLLPNMFTFLNAIFGFLAILKAINYEYSVAAFFIVLAAFLDACDGRLARAIGSTSYFGMELDSLSDAISFCLAPIVLLYTWFDVNSYSSTLVLIFYFCAGLTRLAKFNVQNNTLKEFVGLPTTIAALLISLIIFHNTWFLEHSLEIIVSKQLLTLIVAFIGFLMVSPIKFYSFKFYKIKPRNFPIILAILLFLIWAWIFNYPVLLFGVSLYIVFSIFYTIFLYLKS